MSFDPNTPLDQQAFDDPDEQLFFAIGWLDRPGVTGDFESMLRRAHERGADLNAESEDGETPLTEAIVGGEGAPTAVRVLLELGADPSKRSASGWTPWSACSSRANDPVVSERMQAIRTLLRESGADTSDEALLDFHAAVDAGSPEPVRASLESGIDLQSPIVADVETAIDNDDLAMLRLLLEYGASPEGTDRDPQAESPLARAAAKGRLQIVQLLVEFGADIARIAYDDPRCTAAFLAREAGHEDVAAWLATQTSRSGSTPQPGRSRSDGKFARVVERGTNGINCDVTTERLVAVLTDWDARFGIEISEVGADRLSIAFATLPDDVGPLAREVYELCPDVIDQGYGCMDDIAAMAEETGQTLPPDLRALLDSVDFDDEDFGFELLRKDLAATKRVALWWD